MRSLEIGGKIIAGIGFDGDKLPKSHFVDWGSGERNQERASTEMALRRIQRKGNSCRFFILPIEARIENRQTKIAVDDQICRRRLIGRKVRNGCRFSPCCARLRDFPLLDEIADIVEDILRLYRLVKLYHLRPNFGSGRRLLS